MQTKLTFQKIYIVFLAILGALSFLIMCTTIIGYFTSWQDDNTYISYIKSDLELMKSDLNNTTYKKIQRLMNNGAVFITMNDDTNRIIVKKSSSSSFPKIFDAVYSSNTSEFLNVLDKKEEFSIDVDKFLGSEIMVSDGLFASFGDAFSFRLLLIMRKIVDAIKDLLTQADEGGDSYLSVIVDKNAVVLTLFGESSLEDKFLVSRLEYLIPDKNGRPHMKNIMQHVFFRLFCVE